MVIRTYENYENKKGALIHRGHKFYLTEFYQLGEFEGAKRYRSFKKAQKECIKYINK